MRQSNLSRLATITRVATTFIRAVVLTAFVCLCGCHKGASGDFTVKDRYDKAEFMIPLRDGVELFTIVYAPKDTSQKYPIMLFRTPYSIAPYGPGEYQEQLGPSRKFDHDGYIFVFQDVRGKFKSEGQFELMRRYVPDKRGPKDVDESSDTYDTIEWLLKNIPNHNERVGQWGISYPGWQAAMGMIDAHPALKASSPQATPSDPFIWDDWHHNGAFRVMLSFSWLSRNARRRGDSSDPNPPDFDYGTPWGYKFFLDVGPVARINDLYFHGEVREWNELMAHGTYDQYWQSQNYLPYLKRVNHPVLIVSGWFDSEDFYGPVSIFHTMQKENPTSQATLVVGPWQHGGWGREEGDRLGEIEFGSKTSQHFKEEIEYPFFTYHLKGKGFWNAPKAVIFETGGNRWHRHEQWPPKHFSPKQLYFNNKRELSFNPPQEGLPDIHDAYVSDPQKPVPFSTQIRTSQGHEWMVEDQRFAATRPDVLVYQTDVLKKDVTIAGSVVASIYISTTGTDSDFVVKLIDVFPGDTPANGRGVEMGDFQMLVAGEVFRAKFRNSFREPEPMIPNQVTHLEIDLRDRYHAFRKGHRIMVQVQSTWFPVVDRNPQKFVDIFTARESDFQKATQRLYRSARYPSHLILQVKN